MTGLGVWTLTTGNSFYGFDNDKKPIWQPRHDIARAIFRNPGRVGEASIYYIAPLDVYILPQWSRVFTSPEVQDPLLRKKVTHFEFYQARVPWGPWSLFHEQTFDPQGWYCPVIPSKFVSKDGRKFWLFTAGNPPSKTWYRLIMIPVTLQVGS